MDLPVKVYCSIRMVEETVFFQPVERDGKLYISADRFNGCDIGFCACEECEQCKHKAYDSLMRRM